MTYGNTQKSNHPQKGSTIRVEPIKKLEDIERIKQLLSDNPRDYCLFVLGINTAYRASEILSLTVGQVIDLVPGSILNVYQSKTKEYRATWIYEEVYLALQNWLAVHPSPQPDAPLFLSQRTRKALVIPTLSRMVKKWCKEINLKGNYASHSLRKTWGYHQRLTYKQDSDLLNEAYGHATEKQTRVYLCIQVEEMAALYANSL